jgi:hypothetical protein
VGPDFRRRDDCRLLVRDGDGVSSARRERFCSVEVSTWEPELMGLAGIDLSEGADDVS